MFFRTSTNCPTNDGEAENMFCFRASTPSPPIESDIFNNMEADSIMDLTNDVDTETSMDNSSILDLQGKITSFIKRELENL